MARPGSDTPHLPNLVRRRHANQHHHRENRGELINVWDTAANCYRLPPLVDAPHLSSWHAFFLARLSEMEDEQLLANYSTSPIHESGWFCDGARWRAAEAWRAAAACVCICRLRICMHAVCNTPNLPSTTLIFPNPSPLLTPPPPPPLKRAPLCAQT